MDGAPPGGSWARVRGYHPAFYDGFRREDEPEVWKFIGAYLRKYKSFAVRNGGAVELVVTVFVTDLTR